MGQIARREAGEKIHSAIHKDGLTSGQYGRLCNNHYHWLLLKFQAQLPS